jgi:hypothetical protein
VRPDPSHGAEERRLALRAVRVVGRQSGHGSDVGQQAGVVGPVARARHAGEQGIAVAFVVGRGRRRLHGSGRAAHLVRGRRGPGLRGLAGHLCLALAGAKLAERCGDLLVALGGERKLDKHAKGGSVAHLGGGEELTEQAAARRLAQWSSAAAAGLGGGLFGVGGFV